MGGMVEILVMITWRWCLVGGGISISFKRDLRKKGFVPYLVVLQVFERDFV